MNTVAEIEIGSKEMDLIKSVKKQVDDLYAKQKIFGLSLETLELTRRFNIIYNKFKNLDVLPAVEFNRFVVLTQHLERNLVQEID